MTWTLFFMTVCAFPYVIAFTSDTMEIRLIINGNLVHTIAMPNINLITSKRDVFFATTAPEFLPGKCERIRLDSKPLEKDEMPCSPPPTAQSSSSRSSFQSTWPYSASLSWSEVEIPLPLDPIDKYTSKCLMNALRLLSCQPRNLAFADSQGDWKPIRIYRIPLQTLSRNTGSTCSQRRCPSPTEPEIVSAPPTTDRTFLNVEPHRALSRSCSSSPTPTPTTNLPPSCSK